MRKVLGQHEIATLQTTAIDQGILTVSLTTVLAHASGEWIASGWPVCALSEMATPRRMGGPIGLVKRSHHCRPLFQTKNLPTDQSRPRKKRAQLRFARALKQKG